MATVVYSRAALDDLQRVFAFLAEHDREVAVRSAAVIIGAVSALAEHPFIGRARRGDVRELVVSFGRSGYVALYRFVPHLSEIRILGIRHQRELDWLN